jgi:hypothetical protein
MANQGPMAQLNNNILCAVDINTTGDNILEHEVYEVCILPLDNNYKPRKGILPFHMILKPESTDFDNSCVSSKEMSSAILSGVDRFLAADVVQQWFDKLKLPPNKKIMPLTYDWPYVNSFLTKWMGPAQMAIIFHTWYRDLLPVTLHMNDSADMRVEQIPFSKNYQSYIETTLRIENSVRGDPMSDCVAIAECYERCLKKLFSKVF